MSPDRKSPEQKSPEKVSPEKSQDHSPDTMHKLVYMANQIGKFFVSQGAEQAVPGIADHLQKFWDPRMRAQIRKHLEAGGVGLDPPVRAAVEQLKQRAN
jgi:formate dehydrogenase subunit delta